MVVDEIAEAQMYIHASTSGNVEGGVLFDGKEAAMSLTEEIREGIQNLIADRKLKVVSLTIVVVEGVSDATRLAKIKQASTVEREG